MTPASTRRGTMTWRTLGRGFWVGLIVSLILHGLLISSGRFQLPRWDDEDKTVLEARLEPAEVKAVAVPKPAVTRPPVTSSLQQPPQQHPDATPPNPPPSPSVPAPAATPAISSPPPTPAPQAPPAAPSSPPADGPYSALAKAAQNIRDLPASIEIVYELTGMLSGRQTHIWQRTGQRYSLQTEAEATGLAGLFVGGKLIQKSQGRIGALGLMPEQYEIQRPSGKNESLHFDYDANTIESSRTDARRGTRTQALPLLPGAQDPLSSIYQLAMVASDSGDGLIVAASSKRVKGYPFRVLGTETLHTALGEIKALHVTRAGESDKGAVQLWLAPDRYSLPVKVSYTDEDGTDWVLEAVSIKTR